MNKFRKLSALNKESLRKIKGQGAELSFISSCKKSGDTIICAMGTDIKLCAHFEAECSGGKFSSRCNVVTGVTVTCSKNFTIAPK